MSINLFRDPETVDLGADVLAAPSSAKSSDNVTRLALMAAAFGSLLMVSQPSTAAGLPDPGVVIEPGRTALLVTDPQNDFLSPDGVTWGVVGESVVENDTVNHIGQLFETAHAVGMPVFVSPHYYYKHDHKWQFEGALEALMHNIGMFDRKGPLTTRGFKNSGADWLKEYKPHINHDDTVVTSPHKVFGPETNDLVLQLRKAGISRVILAGMSANLCVEAHMRELMEQGFEVLVVSDATAAAKLPELDGYKAALTNFRMIANHVGDTEETVSAIQAAYGQE
jgi:nicotinamidase-related amidase